MGKKLLCLMLAALLGALCGCQGKAGDGSGLTSPIIYPFHPDAFFQINAS